MAAIRENADPMDRVKNYKEQITALRDLEKLNRMNALASGDWHVQTVKSISASERFTQQVSQQKLGLRGLITELNNYHKANKTPGGSSSLKEAIREQQALRGAMASQLTGNAFGKNDTQLYVPKNLGSELDSAKVKYGMINQAIASAAHQTVNWGKNTQWAGRQITVGLSMPLGMAAVGAAALALKVDTELTRIAKVYDTVNKGGIAQEEELADLREESLKGATRMAGEYGQKMEDILDVQAQLAATGLTGKNLHQSTDEAVRIATLGEMEYQKAVDMTISLQTAFGLSTAELTEAFNMMNAVENATSLGIQDIADAVPRAASALSALGGTVQDMTVMLAAMKESGVNPAEAANALKSATSRLLDPTAEAIETFKTKFNVNLKEVVKSAGGNVYLIMQELAKMTKGFDPLEVQQGINDLFGTYQFNRISALWTNLGDAMNGVQNQTRKTMDTVAKSTGELMDIADQELRRKQESVSGRWKSAVEEMKAALIPLGMTVMEFVTPLVEGVSAIIRGFNDMNGFSKGLILTLLGFAAVTGPILMLIGIFANLFGQVAKFATSIGNLKYKFKALSPDQTAAAIMANNAKSAFNTEAQAAATLAHTIRDLTLAMEQNAVASGLMMSKSGQMFARGVDGVNHQRKVIERADGKLAYDKGSYDAQGAPLGGRIVGADHPDAVAYRDIQKSSEAVETSAKKTAGHWGTIGKALGAVAGAGLIFAVMNKDAAGMSESFMNILMVATTVGMMFPGMFRKVFDIVKGIGGGIKGWAGGASAAASGAGKIDGKLKLLKQGFSVGGVRGTFEVLGKMAPRLTMIAKAALRVFGPIGVLAGGAFLVKTIADEMNKMEEHQRALATSGKAWADAIGYTYTPGKLPGMEQTDVGKTAAQSQLITDMTEKQEGLREALDAAGKAGEGYEAAMQQALRALADGASVAQARQVMQASLDMAGNDPIEISKLMVKFDSIDLSNPDVVRAQLKSLLDKAISGVEIPAIRPGANDKDGFWGSISSWGREVGGGDLTSEARTFGERVGAALADGLKVAATPREKIDLFKDMSTAVEAEYKEMFNNLKKDDQMGPIIKEMGIKSADGLEQAYNEVAAKVKKKGIGSLTDVQRDLWDSVSGTNNRNDGMREFHEAYAEQIDTLVQSIGEALDWDQSKIDKVRKEIMSLSDLRPEIGVPEKDLISQKAAQDQYNEALSRGAMAWSKYSEAEKLRILNSYRAKAGLEAATHWTQGFGDAAKAAEGDVAGLADATEDAAAAANELASSAVSARKDAMSGAWNDILEEAGRRFDEMTERNVDGIRAGGEARQDAMKREGDLMEKDFDRREKDLENYWDNREKAFDTEWENRIAGEEAYWDSRIKGVEKSIEAEEAAEKKRQEIFEKEQQRIERMASQLNSGIDFNVALNSGNLDEAAKIANDMSAREQGWNMEDSDKEQANASELRISGLQSELEDIQTAKEARLDALKKEQEAARENLRIQRGIAEERLKVEQDNAKAALDARMDADRKATDSAIKSAQAQADADKRGLADRLRALQEFIPQNRQELEQHTAEVEAIYQEYGLHLRDEGGKWAGFIGNALDVNVAAAAAALQTEIDWKMIAKNIAAQIGEGMGFTMQQAVDFLRTGVFPAGAAPAAPQFVPGKTAYEMNPVKPGTPGFIGPVRHTGGEIGGPNGGFSQKDRTGVPRSASPYPSEVPALLKAGEYVVNQKATRAHKPLLESINSGKAIHSRDVGGPANDIGGPIGSPLMEYTLGTATMGLMVAAKVAQLAGMKKMEIAKAEYEAQQAAMYAGGGAGSTGTIAGGNAPWERLWNTVKQAFPKAGLNSSVRNGDPGYHGKGMAIDIGLAGTPGGAGNAYMAAMNRWIYDNFRGSTELIYNGLGDDRPNLWHGADHAYNAATQAQHRNHVHWAMTPQAIAAAGAKVAGPAGAIAAPGSVRAQVQAAANQRGWGGGANWAAIDWIVQKESSWNPNAQNPVSTASGLFQHIDGTWRAYRSPAAAQFAKMRLAPVNEQAFAGMNYMGSRYGSPAGARAFWEKNHWYDNGGFLQPGVTMAMNATGRPEPVFTAPQWDILKSNIGNTTYELGADNSAPMSVRAVEANVATEGGNTYTVTVDLRGAVIRDDIDFQAGVEKALDNIESRRGRKRVIK